LTVVSPVKLRIADVVLAVPASVGVEAGMVVLTEQQEPGRSLRIIIGQPEARAISAAWQGARSSRPSTWDLFVSTINLFGGQIVRAVITSVEEERHYHAAIELEQHGERRVIACRPSDAIALVARVFDAEIVAEASVLDEAGVLPDGTKPGRPAVVAARAGPLSEEIAAREMALARREADLMARELAVAEREAALDRSATGDARGPGLGLGES
jgi:bifunctional DNase/RNase